MLKHLRRVTRQILVSVLQFCVLALCVWLAYNGNRQLDSSNSKHSAGPIHPASGAAYRQSDPHNMMNDKEFSIHAMHKTESEVSLQSSGSEWGTEHVLDSGIKLPPGTEIYQIDVLDLHPTQLAVGMQQVHDKMSKVASKQQRGPEALEKFLRNHPVPVVLGPAGKRYLIDHHHLCCALWKMGIKKCYAGTVCDYSELTQEQFWVAMARRNYLWGHTPDGSPIDLKELSSQLPSTVEGLVDDPYRSLAALVRKAGGYQKSSKPFSEFVWANYLRSRVPMVLTAVPDVQAYVHKGISHAMNQQAAGMPGHTPLETATAEQLDLLSDVGRPDLQDD